MMMMIICIYIRKWEEGEEKKVKRNKERGEDLF